MSFDPAIAKQLRQFKSIIKGYIASDYCKHNLAFVSAAKKFIAEVPATNAKMVNWDFHSSIGFKTRAEELRNEFYHLSEWADKMFEAWIKATTPEPDVDLIGAALGETLEQMADGYVDDVFDSKEETEIKPDETATPPSPSSRGGARAGAGRKSIGVKRTVSIALPQEGWDQIDKAIASGEFKSASQFFRFLMGFTEGGD